MDAESLARPQRRFTRYPCNLAGVVRNESGRVMMATVREVAAGGARFVGAPDLRPGDKLTLRFLGRNPAAPLGARVVWVVRKDGVSSTGVEFTPGAPGESREVAGLVASVGGRAS